MGTIAQKGEYLEETKGLIADSINNLGGSITSETTFREYAEELDTIYSSLPKVTGENTEVILTPTLKGKLNIIEKGNSTQETTTGKNLFNGTLELGIINAEGQNANNNSYIRDKDYIGIKPSTNYTISTDNANIITDTLILYFYGDNYSFISYTSWAYSSTVGGYSFSTPSNAKYLRFRPRYATTDTTIKFQVEEGSTATSYEQYTGGIPAPNPSYPFPIKSVTGNNNVVVKTANMFDLKGFLTDRNVSYTENQDGSLTFSNASALYSNPFTFSENGETISLSGIITEGTATNVRIQLLDSNGTALYSLSSSTPKIENVTASKIRFNWSSGGTMTMKNIMLNKGNTALEYQPYTSQTLPLNLASKNLLQPNTSSTTQSGITFTPSFNEIGELEYVNVNGTATADVDYLVQPNSRFDIDSTKTYFLNGCANGGATNTYNITIYYYDSNNTYLGVVYDTGNGKQIPSASKIRASIYIKNGQTISNKKFYPMLIEGTASTEYTPYFTPIELNKIGNYQDYIYKNNDKWYKHTDLKEITMTGTGTWNYISTRTNTALFYSSINDLYNVGNVSALDLKCDRFINQAVYGNDVQGIQHSQTSVYISIDKTLLSTIDVAGFKSWLSSNNTTLLYPLATSTDIEITDTNLISQLENIDKVKGYNGTTIITSTFDSNNAQMILSVSGLKGE